MHYARTSLDGYFTQKKWLWRSQISRLFLIHYDLSENQKHYFCFFTVVRDDLEVQAQYDFSEWKGWPI